MRPAWGFATVLSFGLACLAYSPDVVSAAPPSNDDFDNATLITAVPFSEQVDTSEATMAEDDPIPFNGAPGPTIWYDFVAPATGRYIADTCDASYFAILSVYTGSRGALTLVASAYDSLTCESRHASLAFDATAGETYHLLVSSGFFDPEGGIASIAIDAAPPPPSNDDIEHATQIESLPFADDVETSGGNRSLAEPTCFSEGPSVWYRYTPAVSTSVFINTDTSDYFTGVSVYSGSPGALTVVDCPSPFEETRRLVFNAFAGQTYYILVEAPFGGAGGQLQFRMMGEQLPPRPPNDDFSQAQLVDHLPFFASAGDISAAGLEAGETSACATMDHSVWYVFQSQSNGRMEATTFGSDFNTTIDVYDGSPEDLNLLDCGGSGFGFQPTVFFDTTAGSTYYIRAGGFLHDEAGQLSIAIRERLQFAFELSDPGRVEGRAEETRRVKVDASIVQLGLLRHEIGIGEAARDDAFPAWQMALACDGCRIVDVKSRTAATEFATGEGNEGAVVTSDEPLVGVGSHRVATLRIEIVVPASGCSTATLRYAEEGLTPPGWGFPLRNTVWYHDLEREVALSERLIEVCS